MRRTITLKKPSLAVVNTVADMTNEDSIVLESLHHCVDPDSLNGLFRHSRQDEASEIEVGFSYAGYDVTISNAEEKQTR